jgi:hypothetical protein
VIEDYATVSLALHMLILLTPFYVAVFRDVLVLKAVSKMISTHWIRHADHNLLEVGQYAAYRDRYVR